MNDISTLSDKFSWRRMLSVGLMYKSGIRTYLLLSAAVSLVCFMIVQLTLQLGGNALGVYTIMSFIVALVLYLGPLVFARRDDTLIGLLPVKPVEKWLFYVLFSLVAAPVVVQGLWYGAEYIAKLLGLSDNITTIMLAKYNLKTDIFPYTDKAFIIAISLVQSAMIMVTVLYAVLGKPSHRVTRGVLSFFAALIISGLVSGIAGAASAIMEIGKDPDLVHHPEKLVVDMMPMFSIIYSVLAVYTVVMLWLCYRRIAKEEVKA